MTRGRVHNVKHRNVDDVDAMQRPRAWCDVTNVEGGMTWRDVDSIMDWRRLRSDFMANPAKIFITIWFESYIVVSQAFQTLDKDLDLNSMFLKVEK